jgi:hypothetical protein
MERDIAASYAFLCYAMEWLDAVTAILPSYGAAGRIIALLASRVIETRRNGKPDMIHTYARTPPVMCIC